MSHSFFAYIFRMRYIARWALMRNTRTENVEEHSYEVAVLSHALAVIGRDVFGRDLDPDKTAAAALFHDAPEIITGDLPTPIKYFNPDIKEAYKQVEAVAQDKLLSMLPAQLVPAYEPLVRESDETVRRYVKAADKLAAWLKCQEELKAGNTEFRRAADETLQALKAMGMEETDWFLEQLEIPHAPRQIEFARMNVNYTLTSKRKCLKLVKDGLVSGWNDPRMATLCGMRRRGYPAAAIRSFCEKIGVSKAYSVIDYALLESCVRDELNITADRAMAVLRPLEVVIDNYPDGQTEVLEVEINPNKPELGNREVVFGKHIFIERDDFCEEPPKGYFRLCPEREVRLKGAYYIKYVSCEKDADGNTVRVHCTYDPATKGGNAPDGRKVKGTIHWVSGDNCTDAEVRLYDRLFLVENPSDEEGVGDFSENLNPDSVEVISDCKIEKTLDIGEKGKTFQFMRQGYFCVDDDSTPEHPVFNRTVALKDSWAKKK